MSYVLREHYEDDEYYEISTQRFPGQIWIQNQDGEGMTISWEQAFEAVDKFFKENH